MTAVQIRTPTDQNGNGLPVGRLDSSRAVQVALSSTIEQLELDPGVWLLVASVNASLAQKPRGTVTGALSPAGMLGQFWLSVASGDVIEISSLDPSEEGFAVFTPVWSA